MVIEALLVRCVMLPALLQVPGRVTWQIPGWLDPVLPRVTVEGSLARPSGETPASEPPATGPRVRPEPPAVLD